MHVNAGVKACTMHYDVNVIGSVRPPACRLQITLTLLCKLDARKRYE